MNINDLSEFLAALSTRGILFYTPDDKPEKATLRGTFKDLFYKLHAHSQLEIICLLQGEMALHINGRWCNCAPGMVQVLVPGVVHGEHFLDREKSYRLLWATVFPEALFFHVTEYQPLTGYSTSKKRMAITPPMSSQLWDISRSPDFIKNTKLRPKFHCLLMECVDFFLSAQNDENIQASDYREQVVEQVKRYVLEYYWEDLSLGKLAGIVHYSPGHLNAVFRKAERMPLHRYINEIRLLKSRQLLATSGLLVKQVAQSAGFHDPLYFSRIFTRRFGMSPLAYRKKILKRRRKQS